MSAQTPRRLIISDSILLRCAGLLVSLVNPLDIRYDCGVFSAVGRVIESGKKRGSTFINRYTILRLGAQVHQRFNDDKGNNKVGYITYYMFLSVLPLLLVSLTIFDMVFVNNPELRERMVESTFASIPVIGPTLESDLSFVKGRGTTLIVTLALLIWAAKGGALALEDALTSILTRARSTKSFISKHIRAYGSLAVISIGIVLPTIANTLVSHSRGLQIAIILLSIVWNAGMIFFIFSLLVSYKNAYGVGVIWGGVAITLIQFLSVLIVNNSLDSARPLYGTLAVVLALMFWIALQVRILLYAAVINVVVHESRAT